MGTDDTASAFSSLLCAAPRGLNLRRFAQNRNLTAREASQLFTATSARVVDTPSGTLGFSQENWNRLKTTVVESLACLHRRSPNVIPNEDRVFLEAGLRMPKEVTSTLTTELVKEGILMREPSGVRLRTHVAQLSPADATLWKKTEPLVNEKPLHPPSMNEIASALGMDPKKAESFLVRVSRLGLLVRVSENRFFSPAWVAQPCGLHRGGCSRKQRRGYGRQAPGSGGDRPDARN